jgi:hypothetical protein
LLALVCSLVLPKGVFLRALPLLARRRAPTNNSPCRCTAAGCRDDAAGCSARCRDEARLRRCTTC